MNANYHQKGKTDSLKGKKRTKVECATPLFTQSKRLFYEAFLLSVLAGCIVDRLGTEAYHVTPGPGAGEVIKGYAFYREL